MKNLVKAGRSFYAIGIAGLGIQQFIYKDFRPVILSEWPTSLPGVAVWAYIAGACLVIAGAFILFAKNARAISLILGIAFLMLFIGSHVTNLVFINPDGFHLYLWSDPLKELAFSGGAFVITGSYSENKLHKSSLGLFFNNFIPFGRIFFSITMIVFGYDHFVYTDFVATLVPAWIPWHIFWTYVAGTALICSGICIIFKIKFRTVALLLGIMLFVWFVILHIPRAITDPYGMKGNEITSVFEALAFSGIAFLISCMPYRNIAKS